MAYSKPMVLVYQEYATTTGTSQTAELPPCIIGPCYHIIDAASDEELAFAGVYTSTDGFSGLFPNNAAGALIDETSVVIRFKNAYVFLAQDAVIDSYSANSITMQDDLPEILAVGDYVYFPDVEREYRVMSSDADSKTIVLNRSTPENVTSCTIKRLVEEDTLAYDATGVTIDTSAEKIEIFGIKLTIDGQEYTLDTTNVYIGYMALRQDLSSVMTIETTDDLEARLGSPVPENPLAYGVNLCLANTDTSVKCIAVDSDDLAGYTAAKDKIELVDPLYSIVPLTFSTEVLTMFKNHAEQMSEAENGRWRICIGSCTLQTDTTLSTGYGKVSQDSNSAWVMFTATRGNTSVATGEEEDVTFISSGVDAGDEIIITKDGVQYTYTISSVIAEDMLTVTPSGPFDTILQDGAEVEFEITHDMDKAEQASAVAAVSESYGSMRYVNVWPDICVIDDVELPGYYLCCAVAGGVAGLPSHYGFTRLSMSGIGGVRHSNDYFSQDNLDIIAEGGTFIFVQETEESAPYVRHQLTTDMSAVEFQELSFVKNFDYVSYICRDALDDFLGKWNVTASTMNSIRTSLSAVLESIKLDVSAKIGAPIINYEITSVEQLESDRTRIEAYVNVTFPYPLNTIGLHLISQ